MSTPEFMNNEIATSYTPDSLQDWAYRDMRDKQEGVALTAATGVGFMAMGLAMGEAGRNLMHSNNVLAKVGGAALGAEALIIAGVGLYFELGSAYDLRASLIARKFLRQLTDNTKV